MSYTYKALVGGSYYDLPDWLGSTFSYDFSDVGVFSGEYAKNGINFNRLGDNTVVIAYWNGVEKPNSRFLIQAGEGEDDAESTTEKFVGKSLHDVFRRVVCIDTAGAPGQDLAFDTSTPGQILNNLFTAAQAFGAMTGLTWNFTNTLDSSGAAWAKIITITYRLGVSYLTILQNMMDQGFIEYRINGTVIEVFNADGMAVDRSTGATPVELRGGLDYTELPRKWSSEERAKFSMTVGDENILIKKTDATVPTGPFGIQMQAVSQGGTKNTGTLTLINDAALERVAQVREQLTRKLIVREGGPIPNVDYFVGDYILERVADGSTTAENTASTKYRVRSLVIELDGSGDIGQASLVLNDKFLEEQIRNARRVNGILNGGSADGGGNGLPSTADDITIPNAPTGLLVTSTSYIDSSGRPRAAFSATWNAPTNNTDGSIADDLAGYYVSWKYTSDTVYKTTYVDGTTTSFGNLDVGKQINVRVAATDESGHVSAYVALASPHTLASDTTPPSVPSTPTTSVRLGSVTIRWDGKNNVGGGMEPDFSHVEVHRSVTSGFTPSAATEFDRIFAAGGVVVTDEQAYNSVWFYKFVAVDTSGNKSAASAQATATTVPLVNTDLIGQVINGANIVDNSITASSKVIANTITGGLIQALAIDTGKLAANAVTVDKLAAGSVTAEKIALGVFRSNLVPDASIEEPYATLDVWEPFGGQIGNPFHWRYDNVQDTANGVVTTIKADGKSRSGRYGMSLKAPSGYSSGVVSGAFKPEPGATYKLTVNAGSLLAQANMSVSIETGNGDETSPWYYAPITLTGDTTWAFPALFPGGVIDPEAFETFSWEFTVPASGVTWCIVRIINFNPAALSELIVDDVAVVKKGVGATEITAAGVRLFDSYGNESGAFVNNRRNRLSVTDPVTGSVLAAIDEDGNIVGSTLSIEDDPYVDGIPLLGDFKDFMSPTENSLPGHLDKLPRGIIAYGPIATGTTYSTRRMLIQVGFVAQRGRTYKLLWSGGHCTLAGANTISGFGVRWTAPASVDGVAPDVSFENSVDMMYSQDSVDVAGQAVTMPARTKIMRCNISGDTAAGGELKAGMHKLAVYVTGDLTSVTPTAADSISLIVEDAGPDVPVTAVTNSSTPGSPATVTAKNVYQSTWEATNSEAYSAAGVALSGADLNQGYWVGNGDTFSYVVFSGNAIIGETTKTIAQALTGAALSKVEVFLKNKYWLGGYTVGAALLRPYNSLSLTNATPTGTAKQSVLWPRGSGIWTNITSLSTLAIRGFSLGPAGTNNLNRAGLFSGHSEVDPGFRPRIRITYVR